MQNHYNTKWLIMVNSDDDQQYHLGPSHARHPRQFKHHSSPPWHSPPSNHSRLLCSSWAPSRLRGFPMAWEISPWQMNGWGCLWCTHFNEASCGYFLRALLISAQPRNLKLPTLLRQRSSLSSARIGWPSVSSSLSQCQREGEDQCRTPPSVASSSHVGLAEINLKTFLRLWT